ncbi:MAG: murein biosynthesis integral membrane protein MurJ [Magnetococcales bacterium]|nr:murein biosynthesis integral membrane protein MurJ [Magnetococcales bacterium]
MGFVKGFFQLTTESKQSNAAGTLAPRGRLVRAVGTISFFTLLSRILGFIRDVVIARSFGAGMGADAFFVALKLPNFLRRLFAEGAFSTAFVPVFSDYIKEGDDGATREAAQSVFSALSLVLLGVVVVGQIIMPLLILVIAPGFSDDPEKYQLTVDLTRITFPYLFFISLVALAGGILNSFHRFALPAATPILLNVSLIVGALFIAPLMERPAIGLAIGVVLGGLTQLAIQLPALARIGMPFSFRLNWKHPAIRRILYLMGPSVLGVSVAQVNLLFDIFLASWLPEGSISFLYYADRLVEFPLGLIGIAMGTAILPSLSAKAAAGDQAGLRHDLDFGLRLVLIINIPATVGLLVLREPILSLLFERGAFDGEITRLTAQALLAYGLGLTAFSAIKVLAPAYYAMKDTKTPVRIAIICMTSNMVLNLLLMIPLQHAGLALATTLSAFLNAGLLLHGLEKRVGYRLGRRFLITMFKTVLASAVLCGFLSLALIAYWQNPASTLDKALVLIPIILAGGVAFVLSAWLLKVEEMRELMRTLRKKSRSRS